MSWNQESGPFFGVGNTWTVSNSGTNMIAGSLNNNGIYYNLGSGWTQVGSSPLSSGSWYVSISGTNMIAGSFDSSGNGVYYNIGSGWTQVSISPLSTGNWVVSIDKSNMIVGSTSYTGGVYYNFGSDWIQAETYPVSAYNWFVSISGNNLIVGSISLDNDGGIYTLSVTQPCLLPFTKVKLFDNEYISVQNLSQGDIVKSPFSDKPQMIKQILKNSVSFDPTSKNMPICIPKSFLSQNVPSEDVYISGHHRIIIQTGENNYTGIQAFKLTDRFLTQEELQNKFGDELVYYHIELEDPTEHLIVSDMFVESYQKNV